MLELEELEKRWDKCRRSENKDWDTAADSWERKYRRGNGRDRIDSTVRFLKNRGVLNGDVHVLDVGCGPGRFAAEFAQCCKHVTGIDISEKMCRYGESYCGELGLTNVSFVTEDFSQADIAALGMRKKYDLAFSSITPAIQGIKGLDNLIAASRQWCFNASFIREDNRLLDRIRTEVFGIEPRCGRGLQAEWFFMLLNILWLRGYDPEVCYYDQPRELRQRIEPDIVRVYTEHSIGSDRVCPEEERKVMRFLEENAQTDGYILEESRYRTGWLLWNVNEA